MGVSVVVSAGVGIKLPPGGAVISPSPPNPGNIPPDINYVAEQLLEIPQNLQSADPVAA